MLYLADVSHDPDVQVLTLKLLAQQRSEFAWRVFPEPEPVELNTPIAPMRVGLTLVELSEDRQTAEVKDATTWLLDVVRNFLCSGVTADFLQQEAERAEQWRQALTLQSQELGRRTLELEARMGQIQELEEKLQQDRHNTDLSDRASSSGEPV